MTSEKASPLLPGQRLISLDLLRGIAVLGILIMNIQSFSMISAAYMNPAAYGDLTGINKWIWIFSHLFAAEKFMSLFSILFGAGIILFYQKAMDKKRKAGPLHYRRMFWLLLFGLAHAYFIWYGDILVAYSICAFLVFLFRKKNPRTLIIWASIFFIVPVLFYLMGQLSMPMWPEDAYNENLQGWLPNNETIQQELKTMRSGWITQMDHRVEMAFMLETVYFFYNIFWRVMAMMLLGMALFKSGVLLAQRPTGFYRKLALFGLSIGLSLTAYGIYFNFSHEWQIEQSMFQGSLFNYFGSAGTALGYVGIIMLLAQSKSYQKCKMRFSMVGRMAFSNYILMSLIGMFIFYGNGFGYYGMAERWVQFLITLAIWCILLILSPIWLRHFQYGPIEWFWRRLTYWKRIPMK